MEHNADLVLPIEVVTKSDLIRLIDDIDDFASVAIKEKLVKKSARAVNASLFIEKIGEVNKLDLHDAEVRKKLKQDLIEIEKKALILHFSFNSEPSPAFLRDLLLWVRANIHHQAVLTIGMQPNIGAGFVLRTKNKLFDFTLAKDFEKQKKVFSETLNSSLGVNRA